MGGDAPKDLLAVYRYGECRRAKFATWPRFIAKVGHKWYPNESVTEHLITRIGQVAGVNIADSRLAFVGNQCRFLSRYFVGRTEYLMHGADIFGAYLRDKAFVEQVEREGRSPEVFHYSFTRDAIQNVFPEFAEPLLCDFNRMLAFDCLVGNNDRHFYNWGVLCDTAKRQAPRFSPIFDTARGLFWNHTEERIKSLTIRDNAQAFIVKYSNNSFSKVGSVEKGRVNHFDLASAVLKAHPEAKQDFDLGSDRRGDLVESIAVLLRTEFSRLMSKIRRALILQLIQYRIDRLQSIVRGVDRNGG